MFLTYNATFKDDECKKKFNELSKKIENLDYWMFPCFYSDLSESYNTLDEFKKCIDTKKLCDKFYAAFGLNNVIFLCFVHFLLC